MHMFQYEALRQVTTPLFLTAAYGRKYTSREQAVKDWQAGKDFKIDDGPYCSIRDIELMRKEFSNIYIIYERGSVKI